MPARFIKSAVLPKDFPPDEGIEIAFAGRSNAGKSSLINLLTNHRIAKVSGTPGKTRLMNFFSIDEKYTMVDMPGYGWAARSIDEMEMWQGMIEGYIAGRRSLKGLLLLMDIRREWSKDEELLKSFVDRLGCPLAVVLTKADKVSKSDINLAKKRILQKSGAAAVFAISTIKKQGHEDLEEWYYLNWVKQNL